MGTSCSKAKISTLEGGPTQQAVRYDKAGNEASGNLTNLVQEMSFNLVKMSNNYQSQDQLIETKIESSFTKTPELINSERVSRNTSDTEQINSESESESKEACNIGTEFMKAGESSGKIQAGTEDEEETAFKQQLITLENENDVKEKKANNSAGIDEDIFTENRCIETAKLLQQFEAKCYDDLTKNTEEEKILTRQDIITASELLVVRAKQAIHKMATTNWRDANGKYSVDARKLLYIYNECYGFLKKDNIPIEYVVETRKAVAKAALDSNIIENICKVAIEIYKSHTVPSMLVPDLYTILCYALTNIWNYTDTSEEWAERVTNTPGFLDILHKILTDIYNEALSVFTEDEKWVLLAALGITHNLSMVDGNIQTLREKNFTTALRPHLKSADKVEHLAALSSLAGIVNEEESEIINSNKKVVKHLMKVLRRGLRSEERRYEGWTCKECALTIKMLARNDANKRLLVQLGSLELLVQLAKGNTDEQIEALNAIWALSFDGENRKVMIETDGLEVIETLYDFKDNTNEKIKSAANGTLWNLRDNLCNSDKEKHRDIGGQMMVTGKAVSIEGRGDETLKPNSSDRKQGEGHIMISYQWNNQHVLKDIRNELYKHGLKVWMDVDNMAGSTLQAMAEAVENADIVLMCYSQKYKISPNCRAEAEYTFQRQKPIIPLRMQRDYKPDGWLGILLGTKLFFDFSGKYDFRDRFNRLLMEVERLKTSSCGERIQEIVPKVVEPVYHRVDVVDGPVTEHALQPSPITSDPAEIVKQWTSDDIKNWIIKHNLPKQQFGDFTAGEIALLLNMRREAPESFYRYLETLLNTNLRLIAQLVSALEEIGK